MQRDQSPSGPPRYNLIVNGMLYTSSWTRYAEMLTNVIDVPKFDLPSYIANYKGQ